MEFSPIEQELYDFIIKEQEVTIADIQLKLSTKHVGALGRLIYQSKIIKLRKKNKKDDYAYKMQTYYTLPPKENYEKIS